MDFAVGEDNESFTDHTSWPPESEEQFTTRSLVDPASLSPEPEGQCTTQRTTSDTSVDSPYLVMLKTSRPLMLQHIQTNALFYVDLRENGVLLIDLATINFSMMVDTPREG